MAKKKAGKRKKQTKPAADLAFDKAEAVMLKNIKNILRRKNVSGVDVNYRIRNGKFVNEIVIRIYVEKKLPIEQLHPSQRISEIDGIPIDVVEAKMNYERLSTGSTTTVHGGMRITPAHNLDGAGTLGILCSKSETGEFRLLTNAHVIFGDRLKSSLPSRIPMLLAPVGSPSIPLGDGLKDECVLNSLVDCGLIELDTNVTPKKGLPGLLDNVSGVGRLTRRDIRNEVVVKKLGQRTGITKGVVDSIRLSLPVRGRNFLLQIGIKPESGGDNFSTFGDSGALVIRDDEVVGLLHGTANEGRLAVACHMEDVVDEIGINF